MYFFVNFGKEAYIDRIAALLDSITGRCSGKEPAHLTRRHDEEERLERAVEIEPSSLLE